MSKQDEVRKERLGARVINLSADLHAAEREVERLRLEWRSALLDAFGPPSGYKYAELAELTSPMGEDGAGLSRIRISQLLKDERDARAEAN